MNARGFEGPLPASSVGGDVSGTVVNQNGEPVADATVQVLGADFTKFSGPPQKKANDAREHLEDLSSTVPDSFDPDLSLVGSSSSHFEQVSTNYVAVTTTTIAGDPWLDSADLGSPQLRVGANQELVLTVWNPDAGLLSGLNEYDSQLPGETVDDGEVVIESLAPSGEVVERQTEPLDETAGGGFLDPSSLSYATVERPAGYYRIHPKGSPESAYLIQVGTHRQIIESFDADLRDINGEITQFSQDLRDSLNDGTVVMKKTTTDSSGKFSISPGSNIEAVTIQAYKVPDSVDTVSELGTNRQELEIQDIRTLYESEDFEGSVTFPSTPKTVSVPSSGTEIEVVEVSYPPWGDLSRFDNRSDLLDQLLEDLDYSELPASIQERLENVDREQLEELEGELERMASRNDELEQRVNELLQEEDLCGINRDCEDQTDAELRNRIQEMQQAMNELRDTIESGDTETEIGDNRFTGTFPYSTEIADEDVSVRVHFPNGTTDVLNTSSEYVSVDSRIGRGDAVVIEDYPLGGEDVSSVEFEVMVANEDGIGRSSERVRNPAFDGTIPAIDAVEVSTLHPGPSEPVAIQYHPSDVANFGEIQSIEVYGPDGSQVTSAVGEGNTANFSTKGAGIYHVKTTYTNPDGNEFTSTFRILAGDTDREMPASVRAVDSPVGVFALVGDGLDGGSVDVEDGGATISYLAQIPQDGDPPHDLHIYTQGIDVAPDNELSVRVVRGDARESVSQHIRVSVHTQKLPDGALVYRDDDPLPSGESERGLREQKNGSTYMRTYTDSEGQLTIRTISDPGILDRIRYSIATRLPDFSSPLSISVPVDVGGGLPIELGALLLLIVPGRRRDRRDRSYTVRLSSIARRSAPVLVAAILLVSMIPAPVAAAPGDELDVVRYGTDGDPSFIVTVEDGEIAKIEDWASSSSDRELISSHNASNTATISAPAWHVWSGLEGIEARLADRSREAITFRDPLEDANYVKRVELNRRLPIAEPVSSLTNASDFETPKIGRFAFDDPDYSIGGVALDNDANRTDMASSREYIGADSVSETGSGTTVAVIDSGANTADGMIFGNGTQGSETRILNESKNFITNETVGDEGLDAIEDGNGHGTWVASAVAANSSGTTHDGVAPDASLLVLKALADDGSGSTSDITEAIRYAAEQDADVISMSLGSPVYSPALEDAIAYALDKQDVSAVVVAVGNSRQTTRWIASPADVEGVIGVGATNGAPASTAQSAYFSQIGPDPGTTDLSEGASQDATVDVAAPGMETTARVATSGGIVRNSTLSGTSMATPMVAGGIAVALEANPGWKGDPETVRKWVRDGARPVPNAATSEVGSGLFALNNTVSQTVPDEDQESARDDEAKARDTFYQTQSSSQGGLLPFGRLGLSIAG